MANPFFLRELYLDGCEKINDFALLNLTKTRPSAYPNVNLNHFFKSNTSFAKELLEIKDTEVEHRQLVADISMCGSRGL
jgi:hypothetical protein